MLRSLVEIGRESSETKSDLHFNMSPCSLPVAAVKKKLESSKQKQTYLQPCTLCVQHVIIGSFELNLSGNVCAACKYTTLLWLLILQHRYTVVVINIVECY